MKDSVLKKYTAGKPTEADAATTLEADKIDDLGAFGCLRGIHERSVMLELRKKDGTSTAYAYHWLSKTVFDPSEGITLHFGVEVVKITGRNLNAEIRPNVRLFSAIVRHRVPWIQEADGAAVLQAPKGATIIEGFEIK